MVSLGVIGNVVSARSKSIFYGASRSSVCDVVSEQDQFEDLGSFSIGGSKRLEGVESEEGEVRLGGVDSQT